MAEKQNARRAFPTPHIRTWLRWRRYILPENGAPTGMVRVRSLQTLNLEGNYSIRSFFPTIPMAVVRSKFLVLYSFLHTLQRNSRSDPCTDLYSLLGLEGRRGKGLRE